MIASKLAALSQISFVTKTNRDSYTCVVSGWQLTCLLAVVITLPLVFTIFKRGFQFNDVQAKCGLIFFEAREYVTDQVALCVSFASDWRRKWHDFSGPITDHRDAKQCSSG